MSRLQAHIGATRQPLLSASRRAEGLFSLNKGDLPGADPHQRQQLIQEFFFHLIGAVEFAAQGANESRSLGIDLEDVSVPTVVSLGQANGVDVALLVALQRLHIRVRRQALPANPYDDDGYVFRAWNYRNHVTHRGFESLFLYAWA